MKKLIVLVVAMVMVATSAYAAEWNFYGSARVMTWWTTAEATGAADVDAFNMAQQSNSRIGAKVKVSDELSGHFEYGNGINSRIIYGEWNFGGGSLLIGQTYSPLCMFYSNQVYDEDYGMIVWGAAYSGRNPMIRLTYGDFEVALLPVSASDVVDSGTSATEISSPAIEASYGIKFGNLGLKIAGGYQTYEINDGTTSWDIDSYVIALGASFNVGPGYIKATGYTGENPGGLISSWVGGGATTTGTVVNNREQVGFMVAMGGKFNDMLSVEFGYGQVRSELDNVALSDDDVKTYYAQAAITVAPGVYIIPEIGVIDNEEAGTTETTYFGAKWQINF